ncbi:MarR family winged helix-turn-helix transcriptional regulator [Streptomyces uncialis]|uniref:MarR family winged helix-turn-helix transcriptional regulator n=1 Tax=Streptomyces uncialis TaxID=1048205 RepID=UPI003864F13F
MTTAPSSVTTPSAPPAPASPLAEQPPDAPTATEPPQTGDDATPAVQPRWLAADEQRVWQAYLSATTLLDDHLDRQLQRDAGMPHVYYGFLVQLSEAPRRRLRMTEMARAAKITRSRLSHAIARLERNGWVTREDCPSDRRGQFAVLTDQGYEVLRRTAPGHVEAVRQALFDRLTPAQQKSLGEIMEIVAEGLQPSDAGADLPWLR